MQHGSEVLRFGPLRGGEETKNGHSEPNLMKHTHALVCPKQRCRELGHQALEKCRASCLPSLPMPGAQAAARTSRARHAVERHGEAESQLCTSESLQARLAHHLPPAAAARRHGSCMHHASRAALQGRGRNGQPYTREWDVLLPTLSSPRGVSHMSRTPADPTWRKPRDSAEPSRRN